MFSVPGVIKVRMERNLGVRKNNYMQMSWYGSRAAEYMQRHSHNCGMGTGAGNESL